MLAVWRSFRCRSRDVLLYFLGRFTGSLSSPFSSARSLDLGRFFRSPDGLGLLVFFSLSILISAHSFWDDIFCFLWSSVSTSSLLFSFRLSSCCLFPPPFIFGTGWFVTVCCVLGLFLGSNFSSLLLV